MLMLAGVFRFFGDMCSFVGPVCIEYIIDYAYDVSSTEYQPSYNTSSSSVCTHLIFGISGSEM